MPNLFDRIRRAAEPRQPGIGVLASPADRADDTAAQIADLTADLNRARRTAELAANRAELLQQSNDRLVEQAHEAQRQTARAVAQADAFAARAARCTEPTAEQLLRAHNTIRTLLDRMEAYEGRPSTIACPRACCAPTPVGATS